MAKKASDNLKYYHNPNGPTIGTVSRSEEHTSELQSL